MAKMITITGSPGSGKTVLATALAAELSKKQEVLLINYATCVPMHPVWQPFQMTPKYKSLEKLLSSTVPVDQVDSETVSACIAFRKKNDNLGLLAYAAGVDPLVFADMSYGNAVAFFKVAMEVSSGYVVVDCTSEVADIIRPAAIEMADYVFTVLTPDLQGLHYFNGQKTLLQSRTAFAFEKHRYLAGMAQPFHALSEAQEQLPGGFFGMLPYDKAINKRCVQDGLFAVAESCTGEYRDTLTKIQEVIEHGE